MDHPTVADFMAPEPTTIDVTGTLREAAQVMAEQDVEIVTVGHDSASALADLSEARQNH